MLNVFFYKSLQAPMSFQVWHIFLNEEPGYCFNRCSTVSWLFLLCLCIPILPWLATVWICPSKEIRGSLRGWSLYPTSKKRRTWKGFCTQVGPTGSCSVSKSGTQRGTCTPVFTAALQGGNNRWTDKQNVVYVYTMKYYSALKDNKILIQATTWMKLKDIILILS